MDFFGYFVLFALSVLVVFTHRSDAEFVKAFKDEIDESLKGNDIALETIRFINQRSRENEDANIFVDRTINIRQGLINTTQQVAAAEKVMIDGFKLAKNYTDNLGVAKQILLETFENARQRLYQSAIPSFLSLGKALGLSNDRARPGLLLASKTLQRTGPALLDGLNNADSFTILGIDAGGKAVSVLLLAASLAADIVFVGTYKNIQDGMEQAMQALRDAQSNPMYVTESFLCDAAENDREASDAIIKINKAANTALNNGATPQLVQKFKKIVISSLSDIVSITNEAKGIIKTFEKTKGIDPLAAKISYFQQAETIRNQIHDVSAKMILGFGEVAPQPGNNSNNKIEAAIVAIERAFIEALLAIDTGEDLIVNGVRDGSDDGMELARQAAVKMIFYGKLGFINEIVAAGEQVLSVL